MESTTDYSPSLAEALRRERAALGRYRALLAGSRRSLRIAEARFSSCSEAIDRHVRAAIASLAGRGTAHRAWAAAPQR